MMAINTSLTQEQVDICENYLEAVKIVNRTSKILLLKFVDDVLIPRLKRREKFSNKKSDPIPMQLQVVDLLGVSESVYFRWKQIFGSIGSPEANKIIADWDKGDLSTHLALDLLKKLGVEVSLRKSKGGFYMMKSELRELYDKTVDKSILKGMRVYEKADLQVPLWLMSVPDDVSGRFWVARGNSFLRRPVDIDELAYDPNNMYPPANKSGKIKE